MSIPGANPPDHDPGMRTISEATRCVCGHRWDAHAAADQRTGLGVCTHAYGTKDLDAYGCECSRFEPAEREGLR